jgi:hypothetical protein
MAQSDGPYGQGVRFQFSAGAKKSSRLRSVQTGSGAHPASYSMGPGGKAGGGMNVSIYLHLVPRLRMRGAIYSLPHTS